MVPCSLTLSGLEWLSKIFNDTKHRTASLQQPSFLFIKRSKAEWFVCCKILSDHVWIDSGKFLPILIRKKVLCESKASWCYFCSLWPPLFTLFHQYLELCAIRCFITIHSLRIDYYRFMRLPACIDYSCVLYVFLVSADLLIQTFLLWYLSQRCIFLLVVVVTHKRCIQLNWLISESVYLLLITFLLHSLANTIYLLYYKPLSNKQIMWQKNYNLCTVGIKIHYSGHKPKTIQDMALLLQWNIST